MESYLKLLKLNVDDVVLLLENPPQDDDFVELETLLNTLDAFKSVAKEIGRLQDSYKELDAYRRMAKWKSEQPED